MKNIPPGYALKKKQKQCVRGKSQKRNLQEKTRTHPLIAPRQVIYPQKSRESYIINTFHNGMTRCLLHVESSLIQERQ